LKTCLEADCTTRPVFNYKDKTVGIYCKKHCKEHMIDVCSSKCIVDGCNKRRSYGLPNKKKLYCRYHAPNNAVLYHARRCNHNGCDKIPNFGYPNGKPIRCKRHSDIGMIDVKNPHCKKCNVQAHYNYAGKKPSYCSSHRLSGMIAYPRKRCINDASREFAIYGTSKGNQQQCELHHEEGEYNLKEM
jgi:hypothetical protein